MSGSRPRIAAAAIGGFCVANHIVTPQFHPHVPLMSMGMGTGIAIGIAFGVAIGATMDNIAGGIGIGIALAIALSLAVDRKNPGRSRDSD
jgi:hypothetical protein